MKRNPVIFLSIFLLIFFTLSACSQNLPNIANASLSVVFDFKDEQSKPDARLSVFVESINNVRRCEELIIKSTTSGFEWNSKDVALIETSERMLTGYTNLVVPAKEKIPTGTYNITMVQSDEEEKLISSDLQYDESIYDCLAEEIPEIMAQIHGTNKVAVYNKDNVLIYYGDRTDSLKDVRGIWNNYRDADYFYDVWCSPQNTCICIMPIQKVTLENK